MDREQLSKEFVQLQNRLGRAVAEHTPAMEAWMNMEITIAQLKSLFFITSTGSTNSRKLATALGVTPPNITGIVDHLAEQGLVTREENTEDRRITLLTATDKGKELIFNLRETHMSRFATVLTQLTLEELTALNKGMTALVRAIESQQGERQG